MFGCCFLSMFGFLPVFLFLSWNWWLWLRSNTVGSIILVPEDIKGTDESCKKLYDIMRRFPERPVPYPNVLELTDKGPGAGVHNIEVQDLFLLVCQLLESDHRIHLHRAPHDSVQNEAERTNAAIGEALTTGSPVAPPNDPFHGLPTAELERMCLKDRTTLHCLGGSKYLVNGQPNCTAHSWRIGSWKEWLPDLPCQLPSRKSHPASSLEVPS